MRRFHYRHGMRVLERGTRGSRRVCICMLVSEDSEHTVDIRLTLYKLPPVPQASLCAQTYQEHTRP